MHYIETALTGIMCLMIGGAIVGRSNYKEMLERADDLAFCQKDREFLSGVAYPDSTVYKEGGQLYAIRYGGKSAGGRHSTARLGKQGVPVHKKGRSSVHGESSGNHIEMLGCETASKNCGSATLKQGDHPSSTAIGSKTIGEVK